MATAGIACSTTNIAPKASEKKIEGEGISTEVVKLQVFDKTLAKVSGFVMAYKLYLWMKMRGVVV